ncbi:MAG: hypothetical protein ACE5KT_09985 [Methanosarcinales archaeon]
MSDAIHSSADEYAKYGYVLNKRAVTSSGQEKIDLYKQAIKYLNKALELYLKDAETKNGSEKLLLIGNGRMVEANKLSVIANLYVAEAKKTSGEESAEYLRKAASYTLSIHSTHKEAAQIIKEYGNKAAYYNSMGGAIEDLATYHYYLAWASKIVGNWHEAQENYIKSEELYKKAIAYYDASLKLEKSSKVGYNLDECLDYLNGVRESIKEVIAKQQEQIQSMHKKSSTTNADRSAFFGRSEIEGKPEVSMEIYADSLKKDTYSPVRLSLRNEGSAAACNIHIKIDAPVVGETESKLDVLDAGKNTQLALSIKPIDHGEIKYKLFAQYEDLQGNTYQAQANAWVHVARLEDHAHPIQTFNVQTTSFQNIGKSVQGDLIEGTMIQDSVVQRSTITSSELKFSGCPYCGKKFKLASTPNFCPYCMEKL